MTRRARAGARALAVVLAAVVAGGTAPAGAAPEDPPAGRGLTAAVAAVPATSPVLDPLLAAARRAESVRDRTAGDLRDARAQLDLVEAAGRALRSTALRRQAQADKLAPRAGTLRADLRAIATEGFVTGFGVTDALDPTLTSAERVRRARLKVLAEEALDDTLRDERTVASTLARHRRDATALTVQADGAAARAESLRRRARTLEARLADDEAALAAARREVEVARVAAVVDGTDLPVLALDAYYRAARTLAVTDPGCRLPWWALAGIGRTESRHASYRGADLFPDGSVDPPIFGPLLDGSGPFAVVGDSDGGALDGSTAADRAVGPMQFLPGTWRTVGRDATGDGVADPQNLFDAALGAGALLCLSGAVLDDEAALRRSFRRYNNSAEYVQVVWERGQEYAAAVDLG